MIVDLSAALVIIALVVLVAAGFVAAGGHSLGVNFSHIRQAAEILGDIYILVIWTRTLWRHWLLAGHVTDQDPVVTPQAPEVPNAESSTAASN
jgi:hypothetical protein